MAAYHSVPLSQDGAAMDFSNTIPQSAPNKIGTYDTQNSLNSSGSNSFYNPKRTNSYFSVNSWFGRRGQRSFNISEAPYTHKLTEKHLRNVPSNSNTVRFFDRKRQTRRVFLDCFYMWLGTAVICGALGGVIAGFSSIKDGL